MSESKTDKIVLELLQKVEDKKRQIGNAERPSWITNCSFGFDPSNNARVNIQVIRDIEQLVEIHAFLSDKYETYNMSLRALSIPENDAPFRWLGFSFHQWESDIRTRLNGLRIKQKRDELANLEARVNLLVSPKQRRAIELEKLVKEID